MIKNSFKEELKDKIIINENNEQVGKVLCKFSFEFSLLILA